jgi:hypothetical protein
LAELLAVIENYVTSAKHGVKFVEESTFLNAVLRLRYKHQYREILAAINAILTRLHKFGIKSIQNVLISGMRYSCRAFSAPALRHYLEEYSKREYPVLSARTAWVLVHDLALGFQLRKWEDPTIDKSPMLQVIAGVDYDGSLTNSHTTLYSLFDRSRTKQVDELMAEYSRLLGHLGDFKGVSGVWYDIQNRLREGTSTSHFLSARACLWAFIDSGNPQTAILAARDILAYGGQNETITLPLWKRLLEHDDKGLLRDLTNQTTIEALLDQELRSVEQRMGVKWSGGEKGRHFKAGNMEIWSDYDVHDSLHESANSISNSEDTKRLVGEIVARGSSKSRASLSLIADLLNEYEGLEVPLGTRVDEEHGSLEYAWFPRCCPVEFSNDPTPLCYDMATSWTSSSLGLIRALPDCGGVPFKDGRAIYLMQLGYLGVRRGEHPVLCENRRAVHLDSWTCTGHVVGWDRIKESFIILFMGKGYGILDPGLLKPDSSTYLRIFSAVIDLKKSTGFSSDFDDLLIPQRNVPAYWIDVDPGSGLTA